MHGQPLIKICMLLTQSELKLSEFNMEVGC